MKLTILILLDLIVLIGVISMYFNISKLETENAEHLKTISTLELKLEVCEGVK